MDKLKPCPFCGHSAILKHDGLRKIENRNRPAFCVGEYVTTWKVECSYCGISRSARSTSYIFTDDGFLQVVDGSDGRIEVIDNWNRRCDDGK